MAFNWLTLSVTQEAVEHGIDTCQMFVEGNGSNPGLWVLDVTSSTVKLVPVEVGEYSEDQVAIIAGLKPGDVVVRAGVHKLFNGEKVRMAGGSAQEGVVAADKPPAGKAAK